MLGEMLLLLALAAADTGYPLCGGELTSETWPSVGGTGVPLDAAPVVIFGAHPCDDSIAATATLSPDDGESIAQVSGDAQQGFLELVPAEALRPNTPYVIDIAATAQAQNAGFSTGEMLSEASEGSAMVTYLSAEHRTVMSTGEASWDEVTLSMIDLDVEGASAGGVPFVVRFLEGPPGELECCFGGAILANGSSTSASWLSPSLPAAGNEWCVAPVVRNPDGSLQTPLDEVCATIETYDFREGMGEGRGACACGGAGGGHASVGLALVAGIAVVARGRRRAGG
ncbi:hypothetical protein LBMAG42_44390 [Deltaproteobacteria bacterium]|nr:hypothetical protein LBMAG42_44390 [Deltaproteobacteria bacterium]